MNNNLNKVSAFSSLILCLGFTITTHAGESSTPLQKGLRITSDDLIHINRILAFTDTDRSGATLSIRKI